MSALAPSLRQVLEATGYLSNGQPAAPSVTLATHSPVELDDRTPRSTHAGSRMRLPSFGPEAWWQSNPESSLGGGNAGDLTVYFKFAEEPAKAPVAEWQQEIWNRGFSPLLWIVSPDRIELYNGFGYPRGPDKATENRLETFHLLDAELARLDTLAGRLAMETGQFWRQEEACVDRSNSVDRRLLDDLDHLERDLVQDNLGRSEAQALIGQSIFTQYLIDRKIVTEQHLKTLCGYNDLPAILSDHTAAGRLFDWLRATFNGDVFPSPDRSTRGQAPEPVPAAGHLGRMARFLTAQDPSTGQMSLFPYRFDVIPVELISSIYEQFVHSSAADSAGVAEASSARREGVYYTPLAAVSLVLDEVLNGLTGHERVLDPTCGSGVFLVEALRRLVYLKADGTRPNRDMIRKTLYEQVYGVDLSEAAVRVTAFSLYLAALELDPDPQPPQALRFEPLAGRTLLVGDAFDTAIRPTRQAATTKGAALDKFDVIVGNPPWSYRGKEGTAARRTRNSRAPRQPRGQGLDFVARARDFAHDKTRFGMILSATPFFSRSTTGAEAAHHLVESLAPVTLVNLSDLSRWLFPKANMPAIALLARHRAQRADRMTLVQAPWSPAGEQGHTIEIAPSDITTLPVASWKRNAGLFKAAFLGRRHDLLLLDELWEKSEPLKARLSALDTRLSVGLTKGNRSRDAAWLKDLPFAGTNDIRPFSVPDDLPPFDLDRAQWPRQREIYTAPLLLVKEFLRGGPRPVVAVAERDVVFTGTCFGVSFSGAPPETAYVVAGILGSALASWYLLMTGSTFGLWIQRVMSGDVAAMPMPDLAEAVESRAGKRIVQLVRGFHQEPPEPQDRETLDNAVFDLYGLDEADRIVVRDGLFRASWQWKKGRLESAAPAESGDLQSYTRAFLFEMDAWLSVSNRRRLRAEIYKVPPKAPYRVIRFVFEDMPGPSVVEVLPPDGPLSTVLERIGERTQVPITETLVGQRHLRVHAQDEVSIIKPAARRNWLGVCGLEDADAVVKDAISGSRTIRVRSSNANGLQETMLRSADGTSSRASTAFVPASTQATTLSASWPDTCCPATPTPRSRESTDT